MVEELDRTAGPYTAAKALALASAIFRHAMMREQIASNPCTLIRIADLVSDMAPRQRVLSDAEIRLLWQATENLYPAGSFARLLLLTAVRRSEAAHMTWGEVNLDDALWIVPAQRTKSGVPHEVTLSSQAMDLLRSLPRFSGGDFVFSTTGGRRGIRCFSHYKDLIGAHAAGLANWRFHDLRRTARTNLASLGVSPFIAELILGHQQKGVHKVYDVHRYQAEKREALERWANRLRDIVDAATCQRQATPGGRRCVIPPPISSPGNSSRSTIQYLCERELLELNDAINANFARQPTSAEELSIAISISRKILELGLAPACPQARPPATTARSSSADCRRRRDAGRGCRPRSDPKPLRAAASKPLGLLDRHCRARTGGKSGRLSGRRVPGRAFERANGRRHLGSIPPIAPDNSPGCHGLRQELSIP